MTLNVRKSLDPPIFFCWEPGNGYQENRSVRIKGTPGNYREQFNGGFVDRTVDGVTTGTLVDGLAFEVTHGGFNEPVVAYELSSPSVMRPDLSNIEVGDEFVVVYRLTASAEDLRQHDSRAYAYGRDPLAPDSGPVVEFEGLTQLGTTLFPPIDVGASDPVLLSPRVCAWFQLPDL